jgi:sec-independent protein translocase protein TatB
MFDIGWTELLVIACVAIIVVGPKDLPRMLRTLGQTMGKVRRMSREFQSTFNDALREAEQQADITDMKKQVDDAANFNPLGDLKKSIEEDMSKVTGKPKSAAAKSGTSANPEPAASSQTPAPVAESQTKEAEPAVPSKPVKSESATASTAETAKEPSGKSITEDVKA